MRRTLYLPVKHEAIVSGYPSFHRSGSAAGMRAKYYGRNAFLVRCGQWVYNVPASVFHHCESILAARRVGRWEYKREG